MLSTFVSLLLVAGGLARPQQRQNCFLGQCNQNNIGGGLGFFGNRGTFPLQRFPSFNPSLNIQNCRGSQCNQNNVGGGGGGGRGFAGGSLFGGGRVSATGFERFPSFNPSLNIQNCVGSQCGQNNVRSKREDQQDAKSPNSQDRVRLSPEDFSGVQMRQKREVGPVSSVSPISPVSPEATPGPVPVRAGDVKDYVCQGAVVSSTCLNSHCRIICSDGLKVQRPRSASSLCFVSSLTRTAEVWAPACPPPRGLTARPW